ncbi:hypothetical protein LC653_41620 [Nostoc sp. CHAB 5784]|uniref:hypothetical protein n=1 Tax=Nostoc mirabile TaxID=2907820 RepID=UPI001E2A3386|nr:hypothetical protein [Nostoc mirabile]MCC5670122.1 hypothetical protein [Nostoc mirabile CHAB5784]
MIQEVSENLNISVGSYHKGKKVFELISQLRELEKFKAVIALEMEFNRSIDAAYKFVCNQDICYQVIDLLEADEIGSIGDGIAWMLNGERNPFRRFQLDQVYQFKKRLRPELEIVGRVIGITNEFVVFGLRNLVNMNLEIVNLRPRQIDAELQDEPSASQRKRIFHLMQKFSDVFPVQVSLAELLKLPNLTDKEEVLLRMYESDVFEKTWEDYKTQMKAMERQGHLEIFPNTKPYSAKQITNYKAIRCPMQPGSGSFLLNDDLQAISDSVSIFLDHCDRAASRQDLTKLKWVANKAKKQISRERYRKQESADVAQWRTNWEEIIAIGVGQDNANLRFPFSVSSW